MAFLKRAAGTLLVLGAASAQKKGTESICLGPVPHAVTYDIDADTMDKIQNVKIRVEPDKSSNEECVPPDENGVLRDICVGENTDNCIQAKKSIPITNHIECSNCFLGATAELFYEIDIKWLQLQTVEVGLRNNHLKGAAEFHTHAPFSMHHSGQIPLLTNEQKFSYSFKVAKVFPVVIEIAQPTNLTYDVSLNGAIDVTAGADMDYTIGDHYMKWTKSAGFATVHNKPSLKVTPKFGWTLQADATLTPALHSTTRVTLEKIMTYNLNLVPSLPLNVKVDTRYPHPHICAGGGANFVMSQSAELHYTMFHKHYELASYGPKEVFRTEHSPLFEKCMDLPTTTTTTSTTTTLGPNCNIFEQFGCCDVIGPCRCSEGRSANDQCSSIFYSVCCDWGTACRCDGKGHVEANATAPKYELVV